MSICLGLRMGRGFRCYFVLLLVTTIAMACEGKPRQNASPSPSTVLTPAPPPSPPPPTEYEAVKEVIGKRLRPATADAYVGEWEDGDGQITIDLYSCWTGADFLGETAMKESIGQQADIAADVAYWSAALERFPRELWAADVARYERNVLARIERGESPDMGDDFEQPRNVFMSNLAMKINAAADTVDGSLPQVIVAGGCGAAGEMPVRFNTSPRGAQVMIIPTFFYDVCKIQRLNPDNPSVCKRWREALEGTPTLVAGDYYYVARWGDGVTRRGTISFTEESPESLMLQKPQPR